jgi:transposase
LFLRHTTRRKDGKTHTYWRLVRSVRVGKKVTQQTIATLGELDEKGRAKARALAEYFEAGRREPGLFDDGPPEEPVPIRLDRVRLERPREFGGPWLAHVLWRVLKFDELLERVMPRGREEVALAEMASILAIARLCDPRSELHIAEAWYRKTALDDLLGIPVHKVNDDRLYRALDHLLPHKGALEKHLRDRLGELFNLDYDLLLYDLTSTYFEGEAAGNPLAQRGHSSDMRPDCKQVCIALVVTDGGLPLGYEIFAGNRVGVTTVEEIVTTMERRHGKAKRIWVMDRGMVSEDNLEWLRQGDRQYLVGAVRSELRSFQAELREERDWEQVRDGLEVKRCPGPDGEETFILCRSEDRRVKEKAMHERFSARILKRLESLERRLSRAREPVKRGEVERQIGRILGQNTRAAGKFDVRVRDCARRASGLRVDWCEREEWTAWAELSEGAYVLRTNVKEWSAEELWSTYIQLTDAEAAFRVHKTELSLRPIWHQREERVRAHILVCFLAYVMWKTLEQWQIGAGLGYYPRKIIHEIKRIQTADVVLPTEDGRELRIRCVVQPDRAQRILIQRLGLEIPRRLRAPLAAKM